MKNSFRNEKKKRNGKLKSRDSSETQKGKSMLSSYWNAMFKYFINI